MPKNKTNSRTISTLNTKKSKCLTPYNTLKKNGSDSYGTHDSSTNLSPSPSLPVIITKSGVWQVSTCCKNNVFKTSAKTNATSSSSASVLTAASINSIENYKLLLLSNAYTNSNGNSLKRSLSDSMINQLQKLSHAKYERESVKLWTGQSSKFSNEVS